MLYVTITERHGGAKVDSISLHRQSYDRIMPLRHTEKMTKWAFEIQADGHELEDLYATFPDLPKVNGGRVVRFNGYLADFIIANFYYVKNRKE